MRFGRTGSISTHAPLCQQRTTCTIGGCTAQSGVKPSLASYVSYRCAGGSAFSVRSWLNSFLTAHAGESRDNQVNGEQAKEERHHQAHPGKGDLLPEATQGAIGEIGNTVKDDKEQASPSKPACALSGSRGMGRELDPNGADQDDELVAPSPSIGNHLALREVPIEEIANLKQDREMGSQGDARLELQDPGFRCLDLHSVAPQPAEAHGKPTQDVPQRPNVVRIAATCGGAFGCGGGRGIGISGRVRCGVRWISDIASAS